MQDSLYEFLLLNKKISLPGIGTISLCQAPAQHDFPNKQFIAPASFFTIDPKNDRPSKKLFDWLSFSHGITEWEAIKSVNDFSFDLKKKLSEFGEVSWGKVGVFRRDNNGDLKLDPQNISLQSEPPVTAEKVIRVQLKVMSKRLEIKFGIELSYLPEVIRYLAQLFLNSQKKEAQSTSIDAVLDQHLYTLIENALIVRIEKMNATKQLFIQLNEAGQSLRCDWILTTTRHHA